MRRKDKRKKAEKAVPIIARLTTEYWSAFRRIEMVFIRSDRSETIARLSDHNYLRKRLGRKLFGNLKEDIEDTVEDGG